MTTVKSGPSRKPVRRLRSAMLLALCLAAGTTQAQWVVSDPVHTFQNIATQLQDMSAKAVEYGQQATRWYQTLQHYQQQLIRIEGMITSFGLPSGQPLREVPANYMVEERCGSGLSAGSLLQAISPRRDDDYIQQQRRICQQVQQLQNIKYNETVQFLNKTVPQMQADLKRIEAMRAMDDSNGTVDATTNASATLSTNLEVQFQHWNARMKAYDGFIATLQETQRQLARMALKGESNPLGTVVKAAALQAALKAGD